MAPKPRKKKYDYPKIIPEICKMYANTDKSIIDVLKAQKGPHFTHFRQILRENPEYQTMWQRAEEDKAAALDADFDEIRNKARIAFDDKDKNVNALKIMADITKTRRGHLDARFRDREVKHTHDVQISHRQTMTEGRARLEDRAKIIEGSFKEVPDE